MTCKMSELNEKLGVNDRVRFYDESQKGGRAGAVIWNGFLVWADGSIREFGGGGYGLMLDASWVDESDSQQVRELLHWQKRFCEQKLEDSVKHFEAAKSEMKDRALQASFHGNRPPTTDEVRALRRLRHEVKKWEKRLDEIFELLNPKPKSQEITYTEEEQKMLKQNRTEAEKVLSDLEKLEV